MKVWKYVYNDEIVEVKNSALKVELVVNGALQDIRRGAFVPSAPLIGKLKAGEEVKATLGGDFKIECALFINNVAQEPVEISK